MTLVQSQVEQIEVAVEALAVIDTCYLIEIIGLLQEPVEKELDWIEELNFVDCFLL